MTGTWGAASNHDAAGRALGAALACEVTPYPLLAGRYEAEYEGGVMIGTAEDLLASRRAQMLGWLLFRATGRP
ncbi:MAG: hypothetical protein ACRDOI_31945 [Trebonia sp.]